jgi:hypothetical protein
LNFTRAAEDNPWDDEDANELEQIICDVDEQTNANDNETPRDLTVG